MAVAVLSLGGCDQAETQAASASSAPPPPVNVIVPVEQKVQEFDEFTGRIAAIDSLEVRSRVSGYIQSIGFKDGDEVKKGQLLYQIDPRPYQAELDAAKAQRGQAQAETDYAQRELERIEPLAKTGTASPQELSKAQDSVARAKASIAKAEAAIERAQLDVDYASVKSPIDGRISKSNFTVGNLVGGDTLLTTVVSISPIYVNVDVDERRMLGYRKAARDKGTENVVNVRDAKLPIFVALANETDYPHQGIIVFVDNQVDALTGTIRIRAELDNPKGLFVPGQFVRARFPNGDPAMSMLVPDRAISRDQDRNYVLKVNDKNVVEYQPVTIGGVFGDERAVTKGLNAGDKVVVDGIQRARPGQPVTPTLIQPTTQPADAVK
jgi:multidrug efflux system membrane fusion protein